MGGPRLARVGVTSAIRGEGRSTIAQALALIQATDYRRNVILIEMDLENPSMAMNLRLATQPGLSELAEGLSSVEDVLQPAGPRLAVITAGAPLPDSAANILDLLSAGVLSKIQSTADVLVIDLPPLLASTYGRRAAEMCEKLVMVVHAGITPLPQVKEAIETVSPEPVLLLNGVHSSLPRWMRTILSV
jgi:protein-tyrosine kinase